MWAKKNAPTLKYIIRKLGGSGEGGGFSKAAFHSERYSQLTKHSVFLTNHPAVCLTKTNLQYEAHSLPNYVTYQNTQTQSPPDYQINASERKKTKILFPSKYFVSGNCKYYELSCAANIRWFCLHDKLTFFVSVSATSTGRPISRSNAVYHT